MDETTDDYSDRLQALERSRYRGQYRMLAIRLGDIYVGLARCYAKHGRRMSIACGLLVTACEQYGLAGLTRRGQVAWRYAQWLHRHKGG